ncbi:MAG: PD-(D/E)XK nuclease family protein [Candidatus Nealsonbacteria bacterium]
MLKEIIDQFYLDKQKDREQHHFYITDAGRCCRSIFFKFKNAPREKMEARILRMFDHGDSIHQLIMKPLFSTRDVHVVASEVNIPPQEIVSGRADAVVSDGKELYVLDIKSMNSMVFRKLEAPKEENINQIQLYLHYFKIPKGILLYVNKDTSELKEFIVPYNQILAEDLLYNLEVLKKKIDKDTVPQRLENYPKNWQCQYCQFKDICTAVGAEEMSWGEFQKKVKQVNGKAL